MYEPLISDSNRFHGIDVDRSGLHRRLSTQMMRNEDIQMSTKCLKYVIAAALAASLSIAVGCAADSGSTDPVAEKAASESLTPARKVQCCTGDFFCPSTGKEFFYSAGGCGNTGPLQLQRCNAACSTQCVDDGVTCSED